MLQQLTWHQQYYNQQKNSETFNILIVLGVFPPCLSKKEKKIEQSTWNIPWKFCVWSTMCTRREPLCLEKPIWLWIYLTLNQSKTDCFTYRNFLLKEREPENSKLQSYWNYSNVSLIPSMTKEKHAAITASARKQKRK